MKKKTYLIIVIIAAIIFLVCLGSLIISPKGGIQGTLRIVGNLIVMLLSGWAVHDYYNKYKATE